MIDYLDNEIKLNDNVVYLLRLRTGSSTSRNMIATGRVIGFKGKKVQIKRELFDAQKIICNTDKIDIIEPLKIVVVERQIAIQKLEEAIFWLTYGTDEVNDEIN